MYRKEEIGEMNEATFQHSVVAPLFRAMNFRDVTDFSGGSLELGKDIVMWKEGELGERVNYGVVVKAVHISGKARGSGTASEVLNQVRQCLTSVYADPVTGQQQHIHQCWIISSKIINKTAIHSIESQLTDFHFNKLVKWIHPGANLYDLIEKFLPQKGIIEKLTSVQSELDESMKIVPYRIVADTDKRFMIMATDKDAAKDVPFEIKTQVEFDLSTIDGQARHDQLLEHFRTGRALEIEGRFIKEFRLPEFIPEWLHPTLSDDARLILQPNRIDRIIPLQIERRLASGETVSSGRVDFQITQQGSEQVTLKNDRQGGPLEIEIVINHRKNSFTVNLGCHFVGFGAYELLNALRFCSSMSEDGETDIWAVDIGLKLVNSDKIKFGSSQQFEANIRLLETLVMIQDTFNVPIHVPNRDISKKDLRSIRTLAEIIRRGKIPGKLKRIESVVDLAKAETHVDEFSNEKPGLVKVEHAEGMDVKIFDSTFIPSPCVIVANARIQVDDFNRIKKEIHERRDNITFTFVPVNDEVVLEFPLFPTVKLTS